MKNITLAMVAVLAAVTMLSAVLAVPMQEANAEKKDGDKKDGKDGGNNLKINQENDCERAGCDNSVTLTNFQDIKKD